MGTAANVVTGGGTTYSFTVSYADNFLLNTASFDNADVLVTGPNSFSAYGKFISSTGSGSSRVVTYRIAVPGGSWDVADNGKYTLALKTNQVRDAANNYALAKTLGSFQVGVLPPETSGNSLATGRDLGVVSAGVVAPQWTALVSTTATTFSNLSSPSR